MLRRASALFALPQQCRAAAATVATSLPVSQAAHTTALRSCATNANAKGSENANFRGGRNRQRRYNSNNNAPRVLPPAFDIVHWNDEDIAAGHLLRVIHQDSYIVLDYHRQSSKVRPDTTSASASAEDEAEDGAAVADGGASAPATARRGGHAERVVTVTLPPVYIARFLGVLEGRAERVDVQSRFTTATFSKKRESAPNEKTFLLHCSSRRPTSGQVQTASGQDVDGETVEWTVEMDPAESLMLHRFLTQALQYNTGFCRRW